MTNMTIIPHDDTELPNQPIARHATRSSSNQTYTSEDIHPSICAPFVLVLILFVVLVYLFLSPSHRLDFDVHSFNHAAAQISEKVRACNKEKM
jgi:hypothetical protein